MRARHGVVHQAAGEQLAAGVVVHQLLAQRLADALHRAAVQLPAHDQRVDDAPDVVDAGVAHEGHGAGPRVELHLADVAAVGPGGAADAVRVVDEDVALELAAGQLEQADGVVGAGHVKARRRVANVLGRGLQLARRQLPRLRQRVLGARAHGRAAGEQRARAGAAKAVAALGVAQHHAHALDRHVEGVHHQLRQRGGNALAHLVDGGIDLDEAITLDVHGDALLEHVAARPFQEGGDAQATPQPARARLRRARGKAVPVGQRQRLLQHPLEAADVVGLAHGVGVGHLLGADEVAPPQGDAVDAGLARRLVHQALDVEDGLGPAGAAVGAGGRLVRQHGAEVKVDHWHVVDAGLHPGADQQLDRHPRGQGVGPHVGVRLHPQRQDAAIGRQRQLGVGPHVAPVGGGEELLAALAAPAHRPAGVARGPGDDHVLGVEAGLHAEAAADVAHAHAHRLGRQAQRAGNGAAHRRGHLRAGVHVQSLAVPGSAHGARLQRQRGQPLVGDVERHHVRRLREGRLRRRRVAVARLAGDVVGRGGAHRRRAAGQRGGQRGHGGQLLVVHHHRLGGVARLLQAVGHHGGHGLAHVAHHLVRQRPPHRGGAGAAVGAPEGSADRQRRHAGGHQLGAGDDGSHTGQGARGITVDRADGGMRMR